MKLLAIVGGWLLVDGLTGTIEAFFPLSDYLKLALGFGLLIYGVIR
jgi:hypothetical protein